MCCAYVERTADGGLDSTLFFFLSFFSTRASARVCVAFKTLLVVGGIHRMHTYMHVSRNGPALQTVLPT